ncbi:low-density lipoprotein receptor-related protein 2-like [Mytilus galloprovincialis]|uniref:low-density lipoprotein receptor-related protein 2-like n=1 Tax=Mytilus galloprovincialis TaxID=29158 RepID=UPI003F7C1932
MAYDYEKKYLYLPRFIKNDIIRLRYPSETVSTLETIVTVTSPITIDIDQINEHLYWTENTERMRRCKTDGTNQVTILREEGIWGLVIDLTNRWIIYSNINGVRGIYRVRFNGTEMQTVIAYSNQITSLYLDYYDYLLYFVDYTNGDIKSVTTTGSNLTNILSTATRSENYGVVVNGDHMYCTDYTKIIKLKKYPGSTTEIIHTEPQGITSLFIFVQDGSELKVVINSMKNLIKLIVITNMSTLPVDL